MTEQNKMRLKQLGWGTKFKGSVGSPTPWVHRAKSAEAELHRVARWLDMQASVTDDLVQARLLRAQAEQVRDALWKRQ